MTPDLRKRLEEAARKFRGTYLKRLNIVRELKGKRPLSADEELIDLCLDVAELAHKEGAEWMFKEVGGETVLEEMRQTILGQVKEWIRDRNRHACKEWLDKECADFEADILKLWEGE